MFDNSKDEMILLTSCRRPILKQMLAEARNMVRDYILGLNTEAIRLLRVYFNTVHQLWAHKNLSLE